MRNLVLLLFGQFRRFKKKFQKVSSRELGPATVTSLSQPSVEENEELKTKVVGLEKLIDVMLKVSIKNNFPKI